MSREPVSVEWIPSRVMGRPGHRLMVILSAPGCAWAWRSGGCSNCSFPRSFGTGAPVSAEDYQAQLEAVLARIPADNHGPVEVDLFVSGSYLNPDEVPRAAQSAMVARAARTPDLELILVETRPEHATITGLERVVAAAGSVPLEVGIGLESASQEIRERRIRKGFSWTDFARAAANVAAAGARLLVYVLLKPIATGEAEAVADSSATIETVFALGRSLGVPTRVALEPCFVAPDTPLAADYATGRYRPPWLWSVVEVVRRASQHGPIVVGLSDEGLDPARAAHNCERCTPAFRKALASFNVTQDAASLANLECDCRATWQAELERAT